MSWIQVWATNNLLNHKSCIKLLWVAFCLHFSSLNKQNVVKAFSNPLFNEYFTRITEHWYKAWGPVTTPKKMRICWRLEIFLSLSPVTVSCVTLWLCPHLRHCTLRTVHQSLYCTPPTLQTRKYVFHKTIRWSFF